MEKTISKKIINTLFNIFEISILVLIGIFLNIPILYIAVIFVAFILNKMIHKKYMHYKDWYLCLMWSSLLFTSYYLLSKININIAIISTLAFIFFTNKSDVKDLDRLFFWGGNTLNNEVFDWVKFNQDNEKLCQYEKDLMKTDKKKYYIFLYRFREFKSYSQIADIMDMDKQRISDEIKIISHFIEYSIRLNREGE